jgi:hypothetical protein
MRTFGVGSPCLFISFILVSILTETTLSSRAVCGESGRGPAENRLGAALGVVNLQINDEIVRGLRWNGLGGEFKIFLDHDDGESLHLANIRFPLAYLQNRYGHGGAAWDAQVDYGYARRVGSIKGVADFSLGVRLRWDWQVSYYFDFDEEHLYWMTSYEIGPLAVWRWDMTPRHAIVGEADFAAIALVSRPPEHRYYKIDKMTKASYFFEKTHEDIRMASVLDHSTAHVRLFHVFRAGKRVAVKTGYSLDYAYDPEPRPIRVLAHSISTGVAYAF